MPFRNDVQWEIRGPNGEVLVDTELPASDDPVVWAWWNAPMDQAAYLSREAMEALRDYKQPTQIMAHNGDHDIYAQISISTAPQQMGFGGVNEVPQGWAATAKLSAVEMNLPRAEFRDVARQRFQQAWDDLMAEHARRHGGADGGQG